MQLDLPAGGDSELESAALPWFVVGPENRLLPVALRAMESSAPIADGPPSTPREIAPPGSDFHPLTLVGPPGSGKSHLAQAVVRRWARTLGSQTVRYETAADFGRAVDAAHADRRLATWRRGYTSLRLLVVEDLENLRATAAIRREFATIVDLLTDQGGILVATSQHEPIALGNLDVRISDRLTSGLVVRIQNPSVATRRRMLALAAQQRSVPATAAEIDRLAHKVDAPAAQVLAAVAQLAIRYSPTEKAAAGEPLGAKTIVAVTARYFGVTQAALVGPSRRRSLVHARGMAVRLARTLSGCSFAEIGRVLGGRDHTTIINANRRMKQQLENEPVARSDFQRLSRILQAP